VRPEVSGVVCTGGRPRFLRQLLRCWQRQTFAGRELVIVDDDPEPVRGGFPRDPRIRYLRVPPGTSQGMKLNRGMEAARGAIIQKLDDDDWYHPRFVESTVAALRRAAEPALVGMGRFLVLIAGAGALKDPGGGWFAGGTLCFRRELWERCPFRDVRVKADLAFQEECGAARTSIDHAPELYILVRHGHGHAWNRMRETDVTGWFARRPDYARTLAEVVPAPEDRAFYASLRADRATAGAAALHR